jgi:hypothetical protein
MGGAIGSQLRSRWFFFLERGSVWGSVSLPLVSDFRFEFVRSAMLSLYEEMGSLSQDRRTT